MSTIQQPKSYNPETVQAGQTWAEKGEGGRTFTVIEVGTAGAVVDFGTISFQYFAYCNLIEEAGGVSADLDWVESLTPRSGSTYSRTTYTAFFPEGVPGEPNSHQIVIVCARIVVNPRLPKGSRNRYRFEWRAKVWDHERDAVLGDGHLLDPSCVGPTSEACKRAVADHLAKVAS